MIADVPGRDFRPAHRQGSPLLTAPAAQEHPLPSFQPRRPRPAAETAPLRIPARTRPYVQGSPLDRGTAVWPGSRPVIGDTMAASSPAPAKEAGAPVPDGPGTSPVFYTGQGWAANLMYLRISGGEWDDVQLIAEQGLGRNAAAEVSGIRRNRASIADGVRKRCAAIGRPDLAGPLLNRTHEITVAARAALAEAGAL
jgi:hypothetical protein